MTSNTRPKLLFVVNVDWFFASHRLDIALEALSKGYEVSIATRTTEVAAKLEALGIRVIPLNIKRGGSGPFETIGLFWQLFKIFRAVRPDIVHLVTIKPVLVGGIAATFARCPSVVFAISGLGYTFIARGLRAFVIRCCIAALYRLSLAHRNKAVIFQNGADMATVSRMAGLSSTDAVLIKGSGIDLGKYPFTPVPVGRPLVMMASRLLKDKGVLEFVQAASILQQHASPGCELARFVLVGDIDPDNPASITTSELAAMEKEGVVEIWGYRANMPETLRQASIVVLPSYREGLPKVLIEAAACGRAVVTTDVPGCRDAITPQVTGLLAKPRDAESLATEIGRLLSDMRRCENMGVAGRKLAQEEFDVSDVVMRHIEIYEALMMKAAG